MTRNFRELAYLAGAYHASGFVECDDPLILEGADIRKFAELIIQECTGVLAAEIKEQEAIKTFNEADRKFVKSKVQHFQQLIHKTNAHFGLT
jgi:hypothetical protein